MLDGLLQMFEKDGLHAAAVRDTLDRGDSLAVAEGREEAVAAEGRRQMKGICE